MLKQLKYDFSKLVFQRKYLFILIAVSLFGILYSVLLFQKGLAGTQIVSSGLATFRPIYWLLCCYVMCDVISSDYHYKTLKIVVPYAENRAGYIVSKGISSAGISLMILLVYLLTSNMTVLILDSGHTWGLSGYSFGLLCVGAIVGIFFLESMISFCIVVTESEAATIGFSMGIVIIMFIFESVGQIAKYLPTMWLATLPSIVKTEAGIGLIVIAVFFVLSLLLCAGTIGIFRKKDLFA